MNREKLAELLHSFRAGNMEIEEVLHQLRILPFEKLNHVVKHDTHRPLRSTFSEVILCEGKRLEYVEQMVAAFLEKKMNFFGTRVSPELGKRLTEQFRELDYDPVSRTFEHMSHQVEPSQGKLAILCAGTSDVPVAEEARRTARFYGVEAVCSYDVGIAGLPRLLETLHTLKDVDVMIVVAGMEGALPSVVGGLVSTPIISVPTSVGYGTNFHGISALLSMLNSCAEGISVVNIDNGFGAACAALRIFQHLYKKHE